eukprot:TRINITY_DN3641_c2_g1_i1.p1 TRINITY_DN3641_c2_g1~~TRINITY_DN3641_c2_g1_i1.p1  ORF type:complete len:297 (+),score=69.96 TRINITY_DN3641_c2_g1_i1:82-891(+)
MFPGAGTSPGGAAASMAPAQAAAMRQALQQAAIVAAAGKGNPYPFPMMMPPYPGMGMGLPMMGGAGYPGYGGMPGLDSKGKGKSKDGKGKGKDSKGKGKGKKGCFGKGKSKDRKPGEEGEEGEGEDKAYEGRPVPPVVQAQRAARDRFEKSVMDKLQGRWIDDKDPETFYKVEGNFVSVSSGEGNRVFHNRLMVSGSEICWDARRFWHYLNLKAFFAASEPLEKVEWNLAKDCTSGEPQIVWIKTEDLPEDELGNEEGESKEEVAATTD